VKLVLSTRGSKLALWQAERTRELLRASRPDLEIELLVVQSTGDRDQLADLSQLGRVGVFTAEVDDKLISGEADASVHSLKDMTTSLPSGLVLASVLARGGVEDALVTRDQRTLSDLPRGARVATGSIRRIAMLRSVRPDIEVVPIRGNVDTRLAKLARGEADALIMARAGLERLGLERAISEILDVQSFVPAVGQGIVGLTCRDGDAATLRALQGIGDPEAWVEALAERTLLHHLHGGCNAPIGGHARAVENALVLHARVLSVDGTTSLEDSLTGTVDEAAEIGRRLAERLALRGAKQLIEAARTR
jgi:hydroxymethylbilane synthase